MEGEAPEAPANAPISTQDLLEQGHTFGPYRVIRLLGRGTMGDVYEIENVELERFALKFLRFEGVSPADLKAAFDRESQKLLEFRSAHCVSVEEIGEINGRPWLRMELVRGIPTEKGRAYNIPDLLALKSPTIQPPELDDILIQILKGLEEAHAAGYIHRNLKPANIFFTERGVKIGDLGIAQMGGDAWLRTQAMEAMLKKAAQSASAAGPNVDLFGDSDTTIQDAWVDAYDYKSPEQKEDGVVDHRADLYAVGLIALRMLTGEPQVLRRAPADLAKLQPSKIVPGLPAHWDKWIARAIAEKPEARFQNASKMRRVLQGEPDEDEAAVVAEPVAPTLPEAPVAAPKHDSWMDRLRRLFVSPRFRWGVILALLFATVLEVAFILVWTPYQFRRDMDRWLAEKDLYDPERLREKAAWLTGLSVPDRTAQFLAWALIEARAIPDARKRAAVFELVAIEHARVGDGGHAKAIAGEIKDPVTRIRALCGISSQERAAGHDIESRLTLELAELHARDEASPIDQGIGLITAAGARLAQGDKLGYERDLEQARALLPQIRNPRWRAYLLIRILEAEIEHGKVKAGKLQPQMSEALNITQSLADPSEQVLLFYDIGQLHRVAGDLPDARLLYALALSTAIEARIPKLESYLHRIARAQASVEALDAADRTANYISSDALRNKTFSLMATDAVAGGRFGDAERFARKVAVEPLKSEIGYAMATALLARGDETLAKERAALITAPAWRARWEIALGRRLQDKGDPRSAGLGFAEAMRAIREVQDPALRQEVALELLQAHARNQDWQRAMRTFFQLNEPYYKSRGFLLLAHAALPTLPPPHERRYMDIAVPDL